MTQETATCPFCPYRERKAHVAAHISKLKAENKFTAEGKHPVEVVIPCPNPGCDSVRTSLHGFNLHMRKRHGQKGELCTATLTCQRYFRDAEALEKHVEEVHRNEMAVEKDTALNGKVVEPPAITAGGVGQIAEALQAYVDKITAEKDARIAELEAEVESLKSMNAGLIEWKKSLRELVTGDL